MNKMKKSFKQTLIAVALGVLGMSCIASASEPEQRHVMVKIDKTNDKNAMVDLKVDGFNDVFSLPELNVGESKTITTQSGKEITISKNDKGLSLMIDGKNIALPGVAGNLAAHIQRSMPLHHNLQDNIQISGVELDDNQKQIIKNAFISAGIDKKVSFSNHNIMVFSTDKGTEISADKFIFENAGDSSDIEVIVKSGADSDSNSEIEIHTIDIKKIDKDNN